MMTTRSSAKIDSLIPNPRNNRVHPPEQIEMLKASIERFGQPQAVLARKHNRMLIAGHAIHQAMLELGLPEIEVAFWDIDQPSADEFLLADNRLAELSHFDRDRTRALLESVPEDDFAALGFSTEDIEALFKEAASHAINVYEIDTTQINDEFWISVRGPLADQARALQRLKEIMAEFPGVDVELGTVVR
jgi:ParB-like chromosome segregation protein Spo0J